MFCFSSFKMQISQSYEYSCVSMKSDRSMDPLRNFSGHTNPGFR